MRRLIIAHLFLILNQMGTINFIVMKDRIKNDYSDRIFRGISYIRVDNLSNTFLKFSLNVRMIFNNRDTIINNIRYE